VLAENYFFVLCLAIDTPQLTMSDGDLSKQDKYLESDAETSSEYEEADGNERHSGPWTEYYDESSGKYYYENSDTGKVQWSMPEEFDPSSDEEERGQDGGLEAGREEDENVHAGNGAETEGVDYNGATDFVDVDGDADLPLGWSAYVTDEGREYFYNEETEETAWERPSSYIEQINNREKRRVSFRDEFDREEEADIVAKGDLGSTEDHELEAPDNSHLPPNWEEYTHNNGKPYYYNTLTGETIWNMPTIASDGNDVNPNPLSSSTLSTATATTTFGDSVTSFVKIENEVNQTMTDDREEASEEKFLELMLAKERGENKSPSPTPLVSNTKLSSLTTENSSEKESASVSSGNNEDSELTSSVKDMMAKFQKKKPLISSTTQPTSVSPTSKGPVISAATNKITTQEEKKEEKEERRPSPRLPSPQVKQRQHSPQPQPQLQQSTQAKNLPEIAAKLGIDVEHVANIQNLQNTMLGYLAFLKGETKSPPFTFNHYHDQNIANNEIDKKMTIENKYGLYPHNLNTLELELANRLRVMQNEHIEMKRLLTLHKPRHDYRDLQNSKDPNHWINAINDLIRDRGGDNHIIGNLVNNRNALLCTPKVSIAKITRNINDLTSKAVTSIEQIEMRKRQAKNSDLEVAKLRQANLDLRTKLEIITYDLAEFDELSLETQMLRESNYRSEGQIESLKEEINNLRTRENDMEKKLHETKQNCVAEVEKMQAQSLRQVVDDGGKDLIIAALKEKIIDLDEALSVKSGEAQHGREMLAGAMADLAKQRLEYEDLTEKSTTVMRDNEELVSELQLVKGSKDEIDGIKAELAETRVKSLYLTQQMQAVSSENELLRKEKGALIEEKNNYRKQARTCELELQNCRGDLQNYREVVTGEMVEEQRREAIASRGEVEELKGKLREAEGMEAEHRKTVLELKRCRAKLMKLSTEEDQKKIRNLQSEVSYLNGIVASLESESIEEMGARIHISGVGGVRYNRGAVDGLQGVTGGSPAKGSKTVGIMAYDTLKSEKIKLENERNTHLSEIRQLKSDYAELEEKMEEGNEMKKELQAELGEMFGKLFSTQEELKTEKRERQKLQEAALRAIHGDSNQLLSLTSGKDQGQ